MNIPALSKEQIEQAKVLREQGKTKRELAIMFKVGATTIWDNVYRIKVTPRVGERCTSCEILLEQKAQLSNGQAKIPHTFKLGNKCISCILHEKGLKWEDLQNMGIKIITKDYGN